MFIDGTQFLKLLFSCFREMALEGLFGAKGEARTTTQTHDVKYPNFGVMLDYIIKQQPLLLCSTELREQRLLFSSQTYIAMIKFLLECFEAELQYDDSSEPLSTYESSVETMCLFLEHAMAYEGSVELHSTAFKALITIGSYLPEVGCFFLKLSSAIFIFTLLDVLVVVWLFCTGDIKTLCIEGFLDKEFS